MPDERIGTHRAVAVRWEELPPILKRIHGMKLHYTESDLLKFPRKRESMEGTEDAILSQLQDLILRLSDKITPLDLSDKNMVWSVNNIINLLNSDSILRSSTRGEFEDALREIVRNSGYELVELIELRQKK